MMVSGGGEGVVWKMGLSKGGEKIEMISSSSKMRMRKVRTVL